MKTLFKFICLGMLVLAGCRSTFGPVDPYCSKDGSLVTQEDLRKHVIHVDRDGDFYKIPERIDDKDQPIYKWAANSMRINQKTEGMTNAYKKIFKGIDDYVAQRAGETNPLSITIMIHGGRATPTATLKQELESVGKMKADGTYPVFINWRSSEWTCLKDHFWRIRDGEVSKWAPWTGTLYLSGYLIKAIGEAPLSWGRSIRDNFSSLTQDVSKNVPPPKGWKGEGRFHLPPSEDYRFKWGESIKYQLGYPSRVVIIPFLFSTGTPAWKHMKRRTDVMFIRQHDLYPVADVMPEKEISTAFVIKQQQYAPDPYSKELHGAVYIFAKQFSDTFNKRKTTTWKNVEINLIGHSMGAIVVNQILKEFPDFPVSNIVHMASADNLENYRDITMEYARANSQVDVYNLFLHPRNEYTEKNEFLGIFAAPVGSLLTWIDHSYERPEYVLQRTAGRWDNMRQIVKLIDGNAPLTNVHYKVFGRNKHGLGQPQKHGHFDDAVFKYWREDFWK